MHDPARTVVDPSAAGPAPPPPPAATPPPCPWCGHRLLAAACPRCHGRLLTAPGGEPMRRAPRRGFLVADLARGFAGFFEGAILLFTRPEFAGRLRGPVLANLLATVALGALLFLGFQAMFAPIERGGDLLGFFATSLALLLTVLSLFFLLPPLLELVIGPFLEPLVDVVEKCMGGPDLVPLQRHLWANIRDSVHATAQLLLLAGGAWLATLALSLVAVGVPFGLLAAAFANALTWFELPFYRRGYALRDRLRVLRHNWALAVGFGLGVQVGMLVPIFNILLLSPAAAVGASVLYLRMAKGPRRP